MINIEELFKRDNIDCPDWLSHELLDKEWLDSEYLEEEGTHKWVLKQGSMELIITFDGETYILSRRLDEETVVPFVEQRGYLSIRY